MEKPKKCISVEKAKQFEKKWVETRGKDIENGEGYPDTREFWYSLDELQEYLDYVREKSKEQKVKKPGIRIYLGAYPQTNDKKSFSTIFLAPTKEKSGNSDLETEEDGDENNYEIEPLNDSTSGHPPKTY
ncbi:hypothetical protein LB467_05640 [Salegentibacter sp. JZCK2]|uniref:hypothetical protein n=1 Tax=Salegentibacter tibetensis TaxID=2873600 RepID=UPI001CCA7A5E|nr:hypothetical protein [Salegentibacter tibetensis]MBZ9729162.1 hypothetical protein [Salegentibacter tibetensis]